MVLANSTISNLFFFSYNWQIPLTYVTSQNPHKTHTVWMKDSHGKKKYSNGSMPHGSKLAMLVEWKQPRVQVSLLPFSKEKPLGTGCSGTTAPKSRRLKLSQPYWPSVKWRLRLGQIVVSN